MALPVLETPTYELNLPSTNQKVSYRPFLVKEHKVLMTLSKSSNDEIYRTVNDLIESCTFGKIDKEKLSSFDTEYVFLNIRSRSIGEKVKIKLVCNKCQDELPTEIDLSKLEIERESVDHEIKLRNDTSMKLRFPKFYEKMNIIEGDENDIMERVADCIVSVKTKDDFFDKFTKEEALEFLLQLTTEEFNQVEDFFGKMPKVVLNTQAECPKCNVTSKVKLQGLTDFFL